jgi:hypothetical protein
MGRKTTIEAWSPSRNAGILIEELDPIAFHGLSDAEEAAKPYVDIINANSEDPKDYQPRAIPVFTSD